MAKAELLVLSKPEQAEKDRLERIVDEGKASFVAVGMALAEIKRNPEWYGPQSFESYAESRFGFKAAYVRQLRAASAVASVLWGDRCNCNGIPAKAEGTLRPLAKLLDKRGQDEVAPEQRDRIEAAWARACKLAEDEGCAVAGRHVKAAVDEILGVQPREKSAPDPLAPAFDFLGDATQAEGAEFAAWFKSHRLDLVRLRTTVEQLFEIADREGLSPRVVTAKKG